MPDVANPFRGLVGGRLAIWLEEAMVEYHRGKLRNCYDLTLLALNSSLWELGAKGRGLFDRLRALQADGKIGPEVLERARELPFPARHEAGITDIDLSYLTVDDTRDWVGFLELFFRSLAASGITLAGDPGRA